MERAAGAAVPSVDDDSPAGSDVESENHVLSRSLERMRAIELQRNVTETDPHGHPGAHYRDAVSRVLLKPQLRRLTRAPGSSCIDKGTDLDRQVRPADEAVALAPHQRCAQFSAC